MLARAHGCKTEWREGGVERGNDDRFDGRVAQCDGRVGYGLAAGHRPGQICGTGCLKIACIKQAGARQRGSPLSAHGTAPDKGESDDISLHISWCG
jgi:hypothetical protein